MWGRGLSSCFSTHRYLGISAPFVEKTFLSSLSYFCCLYQKLIHHIYVCVSISDLLHWSIYASIPMPIPHCVNYCGFRSVLKTKSVSPSALPLQECFDNSRSFAFLHSHLEVRISWSTSIFKKPLGIVLLILLNYGSLWEILIS